MPSLLVNGNFAQLIVAPPWRAKKWRFNELHPLLVIGLQIQNLEVVPCPTLCGKRNMSFMPSGSSGWTARPGIW